MSSKKNDKKTKYGMSKDGNRVKYELPKDKFLGVKKYQDVETGEVFEVPIVQKNIPQNSGFDMILYGVFLGLLDELGNQKMKVLKYLIGNRMRSNNLVPLSVRELASGAGVSYKTTLNTIHALEKAEVIKRKTGRIYINHQLIMDGRYKQNIMITYNKVDTPPIIELLKKDGQTSIVEQVKEVEEQGKANVSDLK